MLSFAWWAVGAKVMVVQMVFGCWTTDPGCGFTLAPGRPSSPVLLRLLACLGTDVSSMEITTAIQGLVAGTGIRSVLALGAEKK